MSDNPDNEELSIKGPGGTGFSFKGTQMFPVILVLMLAVCFGYFVYQSDSRAEARDTTTHTAIEKLREASLRYEETQQVVVYMLSLSQEDRQKLNIMRPKALTTMQR